MRGGVGLRKHFRCTRSPNNCHNSTVLRVHSSTFYSLLSFIETPTAKVTMSRPSSENFTPGAVEKHTAELSCRPTCRDSALVAEGNAQFTPNRAAGHCSSLVTSQATGQVRPVSALDVPQNDAGCEEEVSLRANSRGRTRCTCYTWQSSVG